MNLLHLQNLKPNLTFFGTETPSATTAGTSTPEFPHSTALHCLWWKHHRGSLYPTPSLRKRGFWPSPWPLWAAQGHTSVGTVMISYLSFRFSISSRSWITSSSGREAPAGAFRQERLMHVRNVHSFIVHCFTWLSTRATRTRILAIVTYGGTWICAADDMEHQSMGDCVAFYKVQNKDLFFKQVTLVYFIHYTFFLQKKIKLYNCINIKFFHHENG